MIADAIYQFILSFHDGKELLDNVIEALNYDNQKEKDDIISSGFRYIERTEQDTIENTLSIIEKHFGFGGRINNGSN